MARDIDTSGATGIPSAAPAGSAAPAEASRVHELVLAADYERRVMEAKRRVDALGLRYAWVAEQVGCSLGWVSQVLGRHRAGEPTLEAIVALLADVDAGAVEVAAAAYRQRGRGRRASRRSSAASRGGAS